MYRIKSLGFAVGITPYFDTELKKNRRMFLLKICGHLFISMFD